MRLLKNNEGGFVMQMCDGCYMWSGLFVAIAGAVLLMYGLGSMAGMLAHQIAGVLFLVYGLAMLLHSMNMCPMCNAEMKHMDKAMPAKRR